MENSAIRGEKLSGLHHDGNRRPHESDVMFRSAPRKLRLMGGHVLRGEGDVRGAVRKPTPPLRLADVK